MKPISQILDRPLITEKSVRSTAEGQYTFKCKVAANKIEIRQAIEQVYDCKVDRVNTSIMKGKTRRVGKGRPGKTADWKKAVVRLAPDSNASRLKEIFEGA